ncbi:MAG TPA: carboxypeptidase-like regulatory domain-containing protein [Candidatus Acidoferrales bacterium]|nr:carboxypeptidase-like regulatory domain-containing protein [Candidatus Acidoferrales bacterium]
MRLLLVVCVLFLVVGIFAPAVWGQSANTGTMTGVVVDNSKAILPGATVTITQTATGSTRSTTTNDAGHYAFAFVQPGAYSIKVSKQGFTTAVINNQVVNIGLQLTVDVTLQLGAVSTIVTVETTPGADLQTLTPTVGTEMSGAIIMNLPNQSRDASTLAIFQPGQNLSGNVGGLETDQNSFQLDGGFATDDMSGDNNTYIAGFGSSVTAGMTTSPSAVIPMPVTSVQEFKVSTANQTADFNGGGGSQVQLATKRGTNAFHGGAYEYYQDTAFGGANTWDRNAVKEGIVSSHFSRFGADAGGKIPHSNFAGGSWFIFGNYEGYRFPQKTDFERKFPLPSLVAGIIHLNGQTINLNPFPVVDPGCGTLIDPAKCKITAANGYTPGASIPTTMCPGGTACDPRNLGTTTNGVAGGPLNPVITLWNTYLPLGDDCNQGDGLNYCGFPGSISVPQSSNFGVARIDHDFSSKQHFNGTYHYYKLKNTVNNQWDIGGFFPGDTKGQYSAIRQKPQEPWFYTAGLTSDVSSNVTNDLHFSYTRNWWAYLSPSGVPNVAGYPAALEVGGENSGAGSNPLMAPYNTNNQNVRTRYWNGHDTMFRDDVTWIKGNHLFQYGGSYLRALDTHNRIDNGQNINTYEQYIIGDGNSASLGGFGIDMTGLIPAGVTSKNKYGSLYSMVLGMVDQTQSLYTRGTGSRVSGLPLATRGSCAIAGLAATADCISSPPLQNTSIIPTYNVYLTDSWHMKPSLSLNYGIGYTVEMPPYETTGGVQSVMVDQNGNIFRAQDYLNNEKQAALAGNGYAPLIGFSAVRNVDGHSHYPYDPFFGGISPRIGLAWNFRPDTVVRAGYSRIFGRINGVDPVLVPMLTPGLMQPATCGAPNRSGGGNPGGCGGLNGTLAPVTDVFRVGVDCPGSGPCSAPLPAPSANLPQPWYPGFNDVATGSGETIDPNFKTDRSDEFTLSVQHQFGPKILTEAGYIGRILGNEVQYYSMTNVPYMMTRGGQTFANAWAQIMTATNYGTGINYGSVNATANLASPPVQPFFEDALGGPSSAYCSGFANCTTAFVTNEAGNMSISDPFDAWADVSNAGAFVFGRNFTSDLIPGSPFGANGQSPSIVTEFSNGYGNYNAGYLQLTFTDWHGLTMKSNFTYSNALGTGNVVQATSQQASVDPWNLQNNYGPQTYNEKFVFNVFLNYASPYYASQKGALGRLLGGWSIAPLFVWGSGLPVEVGTANGNCGSFGECNTNFIAAFENGVFTKNPHYSATRKAGFGTNCGTGGPGFNVFSNPDVSCPTNGGIFGDGVRNPILGLDGQMGGGGPVTGLPFWNLDVGISKNIKILEKFSSTLHFDFTNVANHMQPNDPALNIFEINNWGVLGDGGALQGNNPRRIQFGLTLDW